MEYAIGIDIGGTKISAGIVDQSGEIITKKVFSTPQGTRDSILLLLENIIFTLTESAHFENKQLIGIGIGTAGQIDFVHGKVLSGTANIKDWNDVAIKKILSEKTNLPIYIDNDVNVIALAEQQLGAGKNNDDVICLALGTGVGGGVISGGKIIRGAWGGGAELGHIVVDMNGPACNCGFNGCLETYASGTGMARRMREKILADESIGNNGLVYYKHHPDELNSKHVFEWMQAGNEAATEVVEEAIRALSYGIVSMIHTFNPTMVLLTGGVLQDGDWFIEKVRSKVITLGIPSLVKPVAIQATQLGGDAGLIGAAIQPWVYQDNRNVSLDRS
ncbi:ROK family protein [Neobacillus dielmonensis]|uniref:ROK family protein n=1 Tax=Neobacillus dielmonensis TaxID=1347369 RepID=UPI0005A6669C|nr:ROK family protein [Neobacillus dielmonensis]